MNDKTGTRTSRIRLFICDKLDWHSPKRGTVHHHPNDPLNFLVFAECRYCGRHITLDGCGNWYSYGDE